MNIRKTKINGSEVRWAISFTDSTGVRKRKFFREKKEAEGYVRKMMRGDHSDIWWSALRPDQKGGILQAYMKASDLNIDLLKAVFLCEEQHKKPGILVGEAFKSYIESKEDKGLRGRTIKTLKSKVGMFATAFGKEPVHAIRPDMIAEWTKSRGWSPSTRRNYITDVGGFFNWCVFKSFIDINPCQKVEKPVVKHKEVLVFTPGEVRGLLKAAMDTDPGMIPYFSIGIFAGLRPGSELERLSWGNIKDDVIEVNSFKVRSARRRFTIIQPNLRLWLDLNGDLPVRDVRRRRDGVIRESGVKWIADGMRHTFGSYHLACFKDSGKTSAEMGHSKPETLFNHYRERISSQAAKEFWSICPSDPFFSPV